MPNSDFPPEFNFVWHQIFTPLSVINHPKALIIWDGPQWDTVASNGGTVIGFHLQWKGFFQKKNQHSVAFYFFQLKRLLWSAKGQKHWADWKYRWILLPAVPDWWKDQRTEGKSTWVHASIMPHIRPWHADGWSFCSSCYALYALHERALMTRGRHKVQLSLKNIPRRPY